MIARALSLFLVVVVVAVTGCLADRRLPGDVGARSPCTKDDDCPPDFVCPGVGAGVVATCLPTKAPACGNAKLDDGEACDDGNLVAGDGCRPDCSREQCGDLFLDEGEACDGDAPGLRCSATCTIIVCGDTIVDEGEACDDGNATGGDGCSSDCAKIEQCGDSVKDEGEACDDGNTASGDGCRGDCKKVEICGDGVIDAGEACDDGDLRPGAAPPNPSDGCDACRTTRWSVDVVTGRGAGGGDALATAFFNPIPAVDRLGRLFVGDGLDRVYRFDDSSITCVVGIGSFGFSGDGGPATGARFDSAAGVAVDDAGRIYLADSTNQRVRRVDVDGTITTIAGTGAADFSGDGGPAIFATLAFPRDVAVDADGRVYVSDFSNCRVRVIDVDGTIDTAAGADCGEPASLFAGGIDVDADGRLLIADLGNDVIWRLDPSDPASQDDPDHPGLVRIAGVAGTVGAPQEGDDALATHFTDPSDVASFTDAAGEETIYVADDLTHLVVAVRDGVVHRVAGTGASGFAGEGGPAVAAVLAAPRRLAVDDVGALLIGDFLNQRLLRVDGDGVLRTVAGHTPAAAAVTANNLTLDAAGALYFSASFDNVIARVDGDHDFAIVAGDGIGGGADPEGSDALASSANAPTDIAFDASGRLVFIDALTFRIRRVELDGTLTTVAGTGVFAELGEENPDGAPAAGAPLGQLRALAADPAGRLYYTEAGHFEIRRIDVDGTVHTVVGTGAPGVSPDGNAGTASQVRNVADMAFTDDAGTMYFSDPGNQRVGRYDLVADRVDTYAGVTGEVGFNGDGIPANTAFLGTPSAVDVDAAGRLFIGESSGHRVRRVDVDGTIHTVAGDGTPALTGDGGPLAAMRVVSPTDLVVRDDGALFVVDGNGQHILLREIDDVDDPASLVRTIGGVQDPGGTGPLDEGFLATPSAYVAVDDDTLLVAGGASGVVERVRLSAGAVDVVAGYPDGFLPGTDPGGPAPGVDRAHFANLFADACGVAWDASSSTAYVANRGGGVANQIDVGAAGTASPGIFALRVVDAADPSTWTVSAVTGPGDVRGPCGLLLAPGDDDALLVADAGDSTIRRVGLDGAGATILFGRSGVSGNLDDLLSEPQGLAADPADPDALFVADTGNHRVLRLPLVRAAGGVITGVDAGGVAAVVGTGEPASSGDGAPARAFPVQSPRGLAFDAFGNLFVTSTRTVRVVTPSPAGVVDGGGRVLTVYGALPRESFPEDSTFCLGGVDVVADGALRVVDACQGYLLALDRVRIAP